MPSFKREGVDPRTGKEKLVRIPDEPMPEVHSCGLCQDSGLVEEGQFCSCSKGVSMRSAELHLPKPKTSMPPDPDNNARSAFDQKNHLGEQLDLFD